MTSAFSYTLLSKGTIRRWGLLFITLFLIQPCISLNRHMIADTESTLASIAILKVPGATGVIEKSTIEDIIEKPYLDFQHVAVVVSFLLLLVILITSYVLFRNLLKSYKLIIRQNRQLKRNHEFKERLTEMIAHDIKNSLNTILCFSVNESLDPRMKRIMQSGNTILNLVTNMLDIQRIEETKIPLQIEHFKLVELIEEARLQVASLFQTNSLRLIINIPRGIEVNVDREIIIRVLVNLLNNAAKFSVPGKVVTLNVSYTQKKGEQYCMISIEDQGEGIDEKKLSKIFDRFWIDSPKSPEQTASTGLGLTFCKLAVESHGGEIQVQSTIGKGTKFDVLLPIQSSVRSSQASPMPSKASFKREKHDLILESERKKLVTIAARLTQLEVYQVGEVNTILAELDAKDIHSPWKQTLKNAVQQGNEKSYKELVEMIDDRKIAQNTQRFSVH